MPKLKKKQNIAFFSISIPFQSFISLFDQGASVVLHTKIQNTNQFTNFSSLQYWYSYKQSL